VLVVQGGVSEYRVECQYSCSGAFVGLFGRSIFISISYVIPHPFAVKPPCRLLLPAEFCQHMIHSPSLMTRMAMQGSTPRDGIQLIHGKSLSPLLALKLYEKSTVTDHQTSRTFGPSVVLPRVERGNTFFAFSSEVFVAVDVVVGSRIMGGDSSVSVCGY